MEPISFKGQVAIVTGAGRGIGRAYALELARRGAAVVVNDLGGLGTAEGPWADAVVAQIRADGGKAAASHHSVATPEGGQGITDTALREFGAVDVVINNAGFLRRAMFGAMPLEHVKEVLDVHLLGAFYVTQPAWKFMAERRYGRVLFTSSAAAFGMQGNSNYCAAKAGLLGLANALSKEGEDLNIKVNAILPYARTMITVDSPAIGAEAIHNVGMQKELGPRMTTDSVVAAALYLASSECKLNGQAISALAGRYARASLALTQGWLREDVEGVTPEHFQQHIGEVSDAASLTEVGSLGAELENVIARVRALDAPRGS
ncbi:MAG TPA: SDR family NAD(P)-dependent oxidoreductase [Variovorax sp.]|nr:SDR family NAD(P)-dependent oxidoreductase [Variovorax sp.]